MKAVSDVPMAVHHQPKAKFLELRVYLFCISKAHTRLERGDTKPFSRKIEYVVVKTSDPNSFSRCTF